MKHIYLIRHGQSVANAGGEVQPNHAIELTDLGHQQAQTVSAWILENIGQNIASIHVSKFLRTQQTAAPLVAVTHIQPTVIEGLQEFDYLSYHKIVGTTLETRRQLADAYWTDYQPTEKHGEDTENYIDFCNRASKVLKYFETLESGNHIVFTHGLWISMLIWQVLGQLILTNEHMRKFRQFELSIRANNCEVFCLTIHDDQPHAITKVRSQYKTANL